MSVYFKVCEDTVKVIPSYDAERAYSISYEPKMIVINVNVKPSRIHRRILQAVYAYYQGLTDKPITYKEKEHFKKQLERYRRTK